jgi:transcriptional regulator with XRE-family HTH domain
MGALKSVADLCKEHGIDHKQLAERTGLDDQRVLAIVLGRWMPSPSERDKVAAAFGLNRGPITWEHQTPRAGNRLTPGGALAIGRLGSCGRFMSKRPAAAREASAGGLPSCQRRPVGLCSWLLALKVFANFPPGPSPSWENGANVIWFTPLPVPGNRAGGLAHGQIWLHLYAQGSWAEGGSAFASPFLLGDELKQDLVSSSRSTRTSGGASIPKRMRPFLADCTTVTRMDSLMRMLSPTFRERTSMIDPSMMSLAATGPSMTLVGCNCPLPVASRPLSLLFF